MSISPDLISLILNLCFPPTILMILFYVILRLTDYFHKQDGYITTALIVDFEVKFKRIAGEWKNMSYPVVKFENEDEEITRLTLGTGINGISLFKKNQYITIAVKDDKAVCINMAELFKPYLKYIYILCAIMGFGIITSIIKGYPLSNVVWFSFFLK